MKRCPFCAEEIQAEAVKCRHCGEFLDGHRGGKGGRITVLGFVALLFGVPLAVWGVYQVLAGWLIPGFLLGLLGVGMVTLGWLSRVQRRGRTSSGGPSGASVRLIVLSGALLAAIVYLMIKIAFP